MRKAMAMVMVAGFLAATGALAGDQATGWAHWADHAERVIAAVESGDRSRVESACMGTTRTVISQGFAFPYWAQNLPRFCGVFQDDTKGGYTTLRGWMSTCRDLKRVRSELAKAKPVDVEPRAKPLAEEMVLVLDALIERDCQHPPQRD
jgi:hypothetical protein